MTNCTLRNVIEEIALEREIELTLLDGFDEAIIGIEGTQVVYSMSKMISTLQQMGMELDEAREYFFYNVTRSIEYVDNPPIIVEDDFC